MPDEMLPRLLLVVAAAVVAAAAAWWLRVAQQRPRRVRYPGLGPGVVLFSSEGCASCHPARQRVEEEVGAFTEVAWETSPEAFRRYQIERVPVVAVLDEAGSGVAWEGVPPPGALRRRRDP